MSSMARAMHACLNIYMLSYLVVAFQNERIERIFDNAKFRKFSNSSYFCSISSLV